MNEVCDFLRVSPKPFQVKKKNHWKARHILHKSTHHKIDTTVGCGPSPEIVWNIGHAFHSSGYHHILKRKVWPLTWDNTVHFTYLPFFQLPSHPETKRMNPPPPPNPYPPFLKWPSHPEKQSMNSSLKYYSTLSIFSILPATTTSWKAKYIYICSTHKTLTHTNRPASDTNSHLVIMHAINGMQTFVSTSAAAL